MQTCLRLSLRISLGKVMNEIMSSSQQKQEVSPIEHIQDIPVFPELDISTNSCQGQTMLFSKNKN